MSKHDRRTKREARRQVKLAERQLIRRGQEQMLDSLEQSIGGGTDYANYRECGNRHVTNKGQTVFCSRVTGHNGRHTCDSVGYFWDEYE